MTNAQKWVAAFLVVFLALFGLSKITEKDETIIDNQAVWENSSTPNEQNISTDVVSLMNRSKCTSCHGGDLKGTAKGPSIVGVQKYWSRDQLINYLRNPKSYSGEDRFKEYMKKYNSFMPSFEEIDVKELGKIADYILNLK